jgi:Fur family ferric uptake transcriptional regulator
MKLKKIKTKKTHHHHEVSEEMIIEILRKHALSITKPRKLILQLLLNEHGPFTVEEIAKELPKNACDLATIYRSLNQFIEAGLVNTTHLDKDLVHYEYSDPEHHHHHIICRICKKIESLEDCFLEKLESLVSKKGYQNIDHKLEFFGICPTCQK